MDQQQLEQLEIRQLNLFGAADPEIEVRLAPGDSSNRLVGYAAVYGKLSLDLGGWKERIVGPQAFRGITSGNDVRALVDHDGTKLLGRTSNSTLKLFPDDSRGLRVEIELPDTSYARDVLALVKRGDARSMSFGFRVRGPNGQRFVKEGDTTVRELTDIDLKEVSVLALPAAYPDTSISVRSAQVDPAVLKEISQNNLSRYWATLRKSLVKG